MIAAGTQLGNRYTENYDVLLAEESLLVVVDGMGSGEGSHFAGRTTMEVVTGLRTGQPDAARMRAAVAEAQRAVSRWGRPGLAGCTMAALRVDGEQAWCASIGDSRIYRWRNGLLEQLTIDHTEAWLGAVNGWWPADSRQAKDARYHLLRYVGHPDAPEPDVFNVTLRPGDVYLLCTDGIADDVSYHQIADVLGSRTTSQEMVSSLLAAAMDAGGNDNATVAVLQISAGAE
jgi:serine/threonine protein phosphatase PrpC